MDHADLLKIKIFLDEISLLMDSKYIKETWIQDYHEVYMLVYNAVNPEHKIDDTYTFYLKDSADGKLVAVFDKNGRRWPLKNDTGGFAPLAKCDYAEHMHEFNQVHL